MQMEMEEGGKLFFDLFVAMCNHMVSSLCLFGRKCHNVFSTPSSLAMIIITLMAHTDQM